MNHYRFVIGALVALVIFVSCELQQEREELEKLDEYSSRLKEQNLELFSDNAYLKNELKKER
jgi:hypothetical protein